MRLTRFTACGRHRSALVAFVDRREEGPDTPDALQHLDRCVACRAEMESVAHTIIALHRLSAELDRLAPPRAAAKRAAAGGPRSWPRLALAGPLLATALAGVLLFPALGLYRHVAPQSDAQPVTGTGATTRQLSAEYLPDGATGSAQFWSYGTYGLTAQVLWPPSGPGRLPLDPERSRFDLRSAGRVPGAWSQGDADVETAVQNPGTTPVAGPVSADSI